MKPMKKILALVLAAALTVSSATAVFAADTTTASPESQPVAQEDASTDYYHAVATTKTDKTCTLEKAAAIKNNKKVVNFGSTCTVGGVDYTITAIAGNAFSDCKKATIIKIPATVKKINAKAFTGMKKLKKVVLKSGKVSIKANAFKGLKTKNITVVVKGTKAQVKKIKKALVKSGFKGKVKKG